MTDLSEAHHEPVEALSAKTVEIHRALVSLREELEAVDWYQQRAAASGSDSLRRILLHNMREEIEHACMLLEWLRRSDTDFDAKLSLYLFTNGGEIVEVEESRQQAKESQAAAGPAEPLPASTPGPAPYRLTVGSLKEAK
jgi:hypothetical protein